MNIRHATTSEADMESAFRVLLWFRDKVGDENLNLDEGQFRLTFNSLISNNLGGILLAEDDAGVFGALAYMVAPDYWSAKPIAQECFWFVKEGSNQFAAVRLLKKFIEAAKDACAKAIILGSEYGVNHSRMDSFYKKLGFRPADIRYIKHL